MSRDLAFACVCGKVSGTLAPAKPATYGLHVLCHCRDCRAVVRHLSGRNEDAADLLLVTPRQICILDGMEHVRSLNLSPRGGHRVYAACCGTHLCNTPRKRQMPFASVRVDTLVGADVLGPVRADSFRQPPVTPKHKGLWRMVRHIATGAVAAHLNGSWRETPFFRADGRFKLPVDLIDKEAKRTAYADEPLRR